jgi:hypothetical protein
VWVERLDAFSGCNLSLRSRLRTGHLWHSDKLIKKRPVMNHGLAQFFGAGFAADLTVGDSVGQAVVFEDERVADGNIRGALLKVTDRIAARGHHVTQKPVGFRYRSSGAVHKSRLHVAPVFHEASTIARAERLNIQALDAIGTLIEARFGLPPTIACLQSAIIFCTTKLSAQFFAVPLAAKLYGPKGHEYNHNHAANDD